MAKAKRKSKTRDKSGGKGKRVQGCYIASNSRLAIGFEPRKDGLHVSVGHWEDQALLPNHFRDPCLRSCLRVLTPTPHLVPNPEEEERMRKAAEESQRKREESSKEARDGGGDGKRRQRNLRNACLTTDAQVLSSNTMESQAIGSEESSAISFEDDLGQGV
ncbi:hypothetical protein L249_6545 [Ophiocordyceps polyrhachis-furcata BCC 54312]|uniref:Uncharacterized protein n=1 Tax=Ophiocordyceps polyrhachis-furcata BCC 54312 TaxID=1330021 RepID=A0A367LLT4_9HYPO|nr:hypothetical protein L249_6545 [Ophiocordyceps polyrhachis-furcata BCC 54312]